MPTISQQVRSFSGGEWSKNLFQREDLEKFFTACQICRNTIPEPQGGSSNRGGLHYISPSKFSGAKTARYWPFVFSYVQAYGLVFEDLCLRFIMNGGDLLTGTVTAWVTSTVYAAGDLRSNGGTNYYCTTAHTSGTFATDLAAGKWYAMPAGNILEIPTPYVLADLPLLKFSQSADTLVITHPSYQDYKLTRTSHINWQLSQIVHGATQQPPTSVATNAAGTHVYGLTAVSAGGEESVLSSTVSSTNNATNLSWAAASGAVAYNVYEQIYGLWGWMYQVGAVTSLDLTQTKPTALASLSPDFSKGPPTLVNPFSGAGNFPGCSAFSQGKLMYGRTNNKPQSLFGSTTTNFFSFNTSTPTRANDGFEFPISTTNNGLVNEIQHIVPTTKATFLFTSGGEFSARGYNDQAWGPTSPPNITPQSNWGVSPTVRPIVAGRTVVFVDRTGKRVRDLLYQITFDGYDTNDLTVMATHLFDTGTIKAWTFVQFPQPIIHAVTSDGRWLTMAYSLDRGQYITSWHRHDSLNGFFEDVMGVPNPDGTTSVYFLVKRTINGSTVRYKELLDNRSFTDHVDGFFVDCGLTYNTPFSITGITKSATCTITTSTSHGLSNGDIITLRNIIATPVKVEDTAGNITIVSPMQSALNYGRFRVVVVDATHFQITDELSGNAIDSSAWDAYTSGGEVRKAIKTGFSAPHLAGQTVTALCDGRVETVSIDGSGNFSLSKEAGFVSMGIPITWQLKPMRFVTQLRDGSSIDRTQQIPICSVRILNTRSIYAAPNENMSADEIQLEGDFDNSGAMVLVSDIKRIPLKHNPNTREGTICFSSSDPCPCTLLDAVARVEYGQS